jgi:hypothetical protein
MSEKNVSEKNERAHRNSESCLRLQ